MAVTLQHLRTTAASKLPDGLAAGQIAFNLANGWVCVGNGGNDILVKGTGVAAYSTSASIFGVAGVNIPARPAGKGYEIYQLSSGGSGIAMGTTPPPAPPVGTPFINTTDPSKPSLVVWNGGAWAAVGAPPYVLEITTTDYDNASPGSAFNFEAIILKILKSKVPAGTTQHYPVLGDMVLFTTESHDKAGTYIYDGTAWKKFVLPQPSASVGGAFAGNRGGVSLASDSDLQPTGTAGASTPDPHAVPTALQFKNLVGLVSALTTGAHILGTYDASTSTIASLTPDALANAATTNLNVGGHVSASVLTSLKEGDYLLVVKGGTLTALEPLFPASSQLQANDRLVFDGYKWHIVASGLVLSGGGGGSIHSSSDVSDTAVAVVIPANQKGLLVRDNSVADGLPGAYKLADVIDAGMF